MTTLAADMDATQDYIANTENDADLPSGFYALGSELVRVSSERSSGRSARGGGQLATVGRVVTRAVAGTTAVAHTAGVALTRVQDPSTGGGSGGVTVDNGSDPPAAVTTLVAPGAVLSAAQADLSGVLQFRLLGPYALVRAELDPDNTSHDTGITVPAGALCIKAFAIMADPIAGNPNGGYLNITAGDDDPNGTGLGLTDYDFEVGYPNTPVGGPVSEPGGGRDFNGTNGAGLQIASRSFFAVDAINIFVRGGGGWHSGRLDIYALIATPIA